MYTIKEPPGGREVLDNLLSERDLSIDELLELLSHTQPDFIIEHFKPLLLQVNELWFGAEIRKDLVKMFDLPTEYLIEVIRTRGQYLYDKSNLRSEEIGVENNEKHDVH